MALSSRSLRTFRRIFFPVNASQGKSSSQKGEQTRNHTSWAITTVWARIICAIMKLKYWKCSAEQTIETTIAPSIFETVYLHLISSFSSFSFRSAMKIINYWHQPLVSCNAFLDFAFFCFFFFSGFLCFRFFSLTFRFFLWWRLSLSLESVVEELLESLLSLRLKYKFIREEKSWNRITFVSCCVLSHFFCVEIDPHLRQL